MALIYLLEMLKGRFSHTPDSRLHVETPYPSKIKPILGRDKTLEEEHKYNDTDIITQLYQPFCILDLLDAAFFGFWQLVHPKYLKITMKGKVKQLYSSVVATSCRLADMIDSPLDFWFVFNKVLLEPHSVAGYNAPVFYKHLLNFYCYHY